MKKRIFTDEEVIEIMKKYNNFEEFYKNDKIAYLHSIKNDLFHLMFRKGFKFNYKNAKKIALKYNNKKQFEIENNSLYATLRRYHILDDITSHMENVFIYWTKETAIKKAKKYTSYKLFKKDFKGASDFIKKNNLKDIAYSHMQYNGNRYFRGVYTYKFSFENKLYAYSGLTYNFKRRYNEHKYDIKTMKGSTGVDKFCIKNNLELPMYEVFSDYVNIDIASKLEKENEQKLKNEGYIILNISEPGCLGNTISKFSFDFAKKYIINNNIKFRNELKKSYSSLYKYCLKNNYLENLLPNKKNKTYTLDEIKDFIIENKIIYREQLKILNNSMYNFSYYHNFIDILLPEKRKNQYY